MNTNTAGWKKNLLPSEVALIEELIPQMGAVESAFVGILNKIAEDSPKFRYLVVGEGYDVYGTNSEEVAINWAEQNELVLNVTTGHIVDCAGNRVAIEEPEVEELTLEEEDDLEDELDEEEEEEHEPSPHDQD
jgi:hypothetical protein